MATLGLAPIVLYSTRGGAAPVEHGLEGATQTWKRGALLVPSSGKLIIGSADPSNIAGVALSAATGVTDADTMYLRPRDDDEFEATLTVPALTYVLVGNEVGNRYGIGLDAPSGFFYADQSDVTNDVVIITGFVSKVGDVNPRVRCRFIPTLINAA
jgi:hypothetical protein